MCRYLLNIIDVENLEPERRKLLEKYLEERRADLVQKISELEANFNSCDRALKIVKKTRSRRPAVIARIDSRSSA
jgi:hypothetical protein